MGVGIHGKQKVRCYTRHPEVRLPLHLRVPLCDHCTSFFPGAKSTCNSPCFLRAVSHLLGLSPGFPFDRPLNGYLETEGLCRFQSENWTSHKTAGGPESGVPPVPPRVLAALRAHLHCPVPSPPSHRWLRVASFDATLSSFVRTSPPREPHTDAPSPSPERTPVCCFLALLTRHEPGSKIATAAATLTATLWCKLFVFTPYFTSWLQRFSLLDFWIACCSVHASVLTFPTYNFLL